MGLDKVVPVGYSVLRHRGVEQWPARRAHNPKVTGSNPVSATNRDVAQMEEQRSPKPPVAGSSPVAPAKPS